MKELKNKIKNVVNLDLNKANHELFEAEYDGMPVMIKAILNHNRYDKTERPDFYINSEIPPEIIIYRKMVEIEELKPYIPKYYISVVETETDNFDKFWLLKNVTEENRQNNLGVYAYLIIEKLDAINTYDIDEDRFMMNFENFKRQIYNIISILCSHRILHGDIMFTNLMIGNLEYNYNRIYFIDFDASKICDTPINIEQFNINEIMKDILTDIFPDSYVDYT